MFNKQKKISRGAAHFLAHFFAIIAPLMKMAIVYNHRFNLYDCCFINSHDHDFDFIGNTHKRALTVFIRTKTVMNVYMDIFTWLQFAKGVLIDSCYSSFPDPFSADLQHYI